MSTGAGLSSRSTWSVVFAKRRGLSRASDSLFGCNISATDLGYSPQLLATCGSSLPVPHVDGGATRHP
jgi:hypothetical protein